MLFMYGKFSSPMDGKGFNPCRTGPPTESTPDLQLGKNAHNGATEEVLVLDHLGSNLLVFTCAGP